MALELSPNWALVIATLLLVVLTGYYAINTNRMVNELKASREVSLEMQRKSSSVMIEKQYAPMIQLSLDTLPDNTKELTIAHHKSVLYDFYLKVLVKGEWDKYDKKERSMELEAAFVGGGNFEEHKNITDLFDHMKNGSKFYGQIKLRFQTIARTGFYDYDFEFKGTFIHPKLMDYDTHNKIMEPNIRVTNVKYPWD